MPITSVRFYFIIILTIFCLFSCGSAKTIAKWESNYNKGSNYVQQDSIEQAWPYLRAAYILSKDSIKSKTKFRKSLVEFYNANILLKKHDVIDSLELTDAVLNISKKMNTSELLDYSNQIGSFADSLYSNRQFSDAIKLFEKRKLILEDNNLTKDETYVSLINRIGKSHKYIGKNKLEAVKNLEKALDLVDLYGPFVTVKAESVLLDLIALYISLEDKINTDLAIKTILRKVEKTNGQESKDYGLILSNIGRIYYDNKLYDEVFKYQTEAIKIFELVNYTSNDYYLSANYFLALVEEKNNNFIEAVYAFKKVQDGFISSNKTSSKFYASVLGKIALNYDNSGDFENAIKYCNLALKHPNIDAKTRSIRLYDMAYLYQNMGQYQLSHNFYDEALVSMKISHGETHREYAKLLNNIGKLYFEENRFEEALQYFNNALVIIEKPEDEKWHIDYSYMLNDYAKTLLELDDYDQAIALMEKNLDYLDKKSKPQNEEYYNRKYNLAKAYNVNGDFQKALPLIKESTTKLGDILGKEHIDYGDFLKTLSNTYFGLGMKDEAITNLLKSNTVFVNQIDKIFQFSSEQEKAAFIKMITTNFNQIQSIAVVKNNKDSKLDIINLNNQLMLKGLLLNNSKDILTKLNRTENDSLKSKIRAYKNLKNKLSKLLTNYSTSANKQVDSLKLVVNQKEAELVKLYYTNFKENMSLTRNWEDVRNKLKEGEIVIEFSHFDEYVSNRSTDKVLYIAYIVTKDQTQPMVINLFEEKELLALLNQSSPNSLYKARGSKGKSMTSTKGLYDLVWQPIENYLKNLSTTNTIYYSLSGLLNQIPIAALGNKEKSILSSRYDLFQLSSTYNLTKEDKKNSYDTTLLIGGVDYDFLPANAKINDSLASSGTILPEYFYDEETNSNSKWDLLPGTLEEVKAIAKILKSNGKDYSVLDSGNASESQFKVLSGNSPNVIHIATHGFFFENPEESHLNIDEENSNIYRSSKDPLMRSGLLLSGANHAWANKDFKSDGEDGILTAMEIANLDLSNTSVVVLSACDTGLGDINGSEGVYGLQRAFKMAGVDTLIMSLWQVPDKETALFMKAFYENWVDGSDIRTAFIKTQRSLSEKYKNEPYKWAAFVLFE